jgi:hypothetical protein
MSALPDDPLSDFVESVDELISRFFAFDALTELRDSSACDIKD